MPRIIEETFDLTRLLTPLDIAVGQSEFSVFVAFHPARGMLARDRTGLPDHVELARDTPRLPPNVLAVRFEVGSNARSLRVASYHERLEPVQYFVIHGGSTYLVEAEHCQPTNHIQRVQNVEDEILTPARYCDELKAIVESGHVLIEEGKEDTPYRRFFATLDYRTSPHLITERCQYDENAVDDRKFSEVQPSLEAFLQARVSLPDDDIDKEVISHAHRDLLGGHIRDLSILFKETAQKTLDANGPELSKKIDTAFERFSNGELRLPLTSGAIACQPSSGYYFLFAELARFAIEFQIHHEFWEPILNALVRTQKIYTTVYPVHDPGGTAQFDTYGACSFVGSRDEDFKQSIRDEFPPHLRKSELYRRAVRQARNAMPGLVVAS